MSADRTIELNELIEQGLTYESAERIIDDRDYADWVSRGRPIESNPTMIDDVNTPEPPATAVSAGTACSLPVSVLDDYESGTACIQYRDGSGKVKDWFIGCVPNMDSESTLRAHLKRHLPAAAFLGYAIK